MNSEHKALRAMLSGMAPKRAEAYIRSFELPGDEEYCILQIDVRRQSYTQVSGQMNVSPEYIKKCRRRAYSKITDAVKHS